MLPQRKACLSLLADDAPSGQPVPVSGLLSGLVQADRRPSGSPEETADRLNRLRAGVLGANDGIVSVAAIVVGVAGATTHSGTILAAGLAALIGGALSMALGEYVSVSSQRDSQRASGTPDEEHVSPWSAAFASGLSFLVGGVLPLLAMVLLTATIRIPVTVVVVLIALAATGAAGAALGGAPVGRATIRVMIGGALALLVTFAIGSLLGVSGIA
jgi:VIT1/CCC1 family predicted Fe2+/Mn2+ transporter